MTAREHRREIRLRVRAIAARYPRPVRVLALADEQAIADMRLLHTGLVQLERGANAAIREMAT